MPGALTAALSAPLHELQALVGPGWSGAGPASALAGLQDTLSGVAEAVDAAARQAGAGWTGAGARGAEEFSGATSVAVLRLAEYAGELGAGTRAAGAAAAHARGRLRDIVDRFESRAAALEPHLDTPGVAEELLAEAQGALREAVTVVEELRAELDSRSAAVSPAGGSAPMSMPGAPTGVGGGTSPTAGSGSGGTTPSGGGEYASLASLTTPRPDAATFGDGTAVALPGGATADAPNQVAAEAVRHALTQLGVPYQWGGTTPGVGLDCSGLTQWAYREAGLDIPRLAQEQDVGAAVSPGALRPGDLAVWSGHVAMIVGDGVMIEAGDPVQLSPVRTTNAGQGFHGFFRPTG
ncbi:glycoside hydrolase [Mycobacterium sp. 852013-51886_SCH5428379]|uniref:C40 family peptidase n=1 Tax=Mycobacterium sp. 852013-51886_SCH5428379 TaxID=1834111 RepID=UPI0007FC9B86|nr:C40 family peptidase [Mycobacterium sp. 852013-51886_SCH5428379]OBB58147.1 glycoside hydrolase [Mycobacterium sp. 852013-51886_SCH5428379]